MDNDVLFSLALVIVLGIGSQWVAWRVHLPSILLMLACGLVVGPILGVLDPANLFSNDFLFAFVSLSVGLILFEGGLSLRMAELRQVGYVVFALCSVGAAVTWAIAALAAYWFLKLSPPMALLQGALLVVTGPTVVGPLLRHIKPTQRLAATLKWEGILIDPVGAILAVLILEAILHRSLAATPWVILRGGSMALLAGTLVGAVAALLLTQIIKRHWAPDALQNPFALMLVVIAFTGSNYLVDESGLVAVTVMGIIIANQSGLYVQHIVEFKENLRVLLLGSLFILLAARIDLESLRQLGWAIVPFLLTLIFVARPLAAWLSTMRTTLSWKERVFVGWMAPRGIVAAAVSALFALRLELAEQLEGQLLVPITFVVILVTVAVYGLTASPLARKLGVSQQDPQGVMLVGAHPLARAMAEALNKEGFATLLVDTNRAQLIEARLQGLRTFYGNILAEHTLEEMDLSSIGRVLAMTPNDEANSMIALHCSELFGRKESYQLVADTRSHVATTQMHGRRLFREGKTYRDMTERFQAGAVIKKSKLSKEFDYAAFRQHYGDRVVPLFRISSKGVLSVCTSESPQEPEPGTTLIILTDQVDTPERKNGSQGSDARSNAPAAESSE